MTKAADWSGKVGDTWAQEWRGTERAFAGLAPYLDAAILAAAPDRAFTAIDIGCGAGSTAIALANARADADVTGVDLSDALIAVAIGRSHPCVNLRFRAGDAVGMVAAAAPIDLLFSRHGVMFFADPTAAFTTFANAMAPNGRIVFSCFASPDDNPWATIITPSPDRSSSYVPGPFAFADPSRGETFLTAAGWRDIAARRVDFTYRVGKGDDPVAQGAAFLRRIGPAASALRDASPADRPMLERRLIDALAAARKGDTVDFPAAAWIWTARASGGTP